MTMRLTLLCHAATSAVRASAFPGDEPLEERARQKLAALPHRLGGNRVLTGPAHARGKPPKRLVLPPPSNPR